MPTIREQILAYLPVFLEAGVGAGVKVERARKRAIEADEALFVNIVPGADPRQETGGVDFTDRVLTVDFQIHARGDQPDSLADPVVDALHSKLVSDRTLGGLALDLVAGDNEYEWDEAEADLCVVHQRYEILYRTDETNLSA